MDKGAIKYVLSGANIMCPGLTSAGAKLTPDISAGRPVAIMAEGKQHALGIGLMKLSSADIKNVNKGIGVDNVHYITDGLYKVTTLQ